MASSVDKSEIAFFDVETSVPTRSGQGTAILEFGAILVCPRKLIELDKYSTLVKPYDLSLISNRFDRGNGINRDAVISAPTFAEIADKVYDILHGRIWAGHNILRFDCARISEAFNEINRPAPEPKGTIDSLALLTQRFGRRAGDMKMASLATYFGIGQQTHRSLDDVRMNLEVLKYCATVLFLESSLPDIFIENSWVSPNATAGSRSNGKASPEGMGLDTRSSISKKFLKLTDASIPPPRDLPEELQPRTLTSFEPVIEEGLGDVRKRKLATTATGWARKRTASEAKASRTAEPEPASIPTAASEEVTPFELQDPPVILTQGLPPSTQPLSEWPEPLLLEMTSAYLNEAMRRLEESSRAKSDLEKKVSRLEEDLHGEQTKVVSLADNVSRQFDQLSNKEQTIVHLMVEQARMKTEQEKTEKEMRGLTFNFARRVKRALHVGASQFRCGQECMEELVAFNQSAFDYGFTQAVQKIQEMYPKLDLNVFISCQNFNPAGGEEIDRRLEDFRRPTMIDPELYNEAVDAVIDALKGMPNEDIHLWEPEVPPSPAIVEVDQEADRSDPQSLQQDFAVALRDVTMPKNVGDSSLIEGVENPP